MNWLRLLSVFLCLAGPPSVAVAAQRQASPTAVTVRQVSVADPGHAAIPVVIWSPSSGAGLKLKDHRSGHERMAGRHASAFALRQGGRKAERARLRVGR